MFEFFVPPLVPVGHLLGLINHWKSIQTPGMSVGHGQSPVLDNGVGHLGHGGGLVVTVLDAE